jgi:DNA-binding NarL/FixJ family response regulator
LFCQALATSVEQRFTVLSTGSTLSEAEQALERHQPQLSLLVVDPPFPNAGFADTCRNLVGRYPMTHALLVFRERRPEDFVLAYQQGARGLFDMAISVDQLINGLERLTSGEVVMQPEILRDMMQMRARVNAADRDHQRLTAAQTRMLALLSKGYTSKEIARQMQSTSASVNHHIERASQQLGARHRTEAVARALRLGIIT